MIGSQGCGGGDAPPQPEMSPPSLAATPEIKAAMELGSAQSLEKSRKTKQAIEAYRRIIREYPESTQAKIAGDKIQALRAK